MKHIGKSVLISASRWTLLVTHHLVWGAAVLIQTMAIALTPMLYFNDSAFLFVASLGLYILFLVGAIGTDPLISLRWTGIDISSEKTGKRVFRYFLLPMAGLLVISVIWSNMPLFVLVLLVAFPVMQYCFHAIAFQGFGSISSRRFREGSHLPRLLSLLVIILLAFGFHKCRTLHAEVPGSDGVLISVVILYMVSLVGALATRNDR